MIVLLKKKWSSRIESANVWDKNLGVWDGVNDKLDMTEENTSEFECIVLESVQNETHRKKKDHIKYFWIWKWCDNS